MTIANWLPLLMLMAFALIARAMASNWLAPSALAPLLWSGFIFVPIVVAPEYPVSPLAVWVILLLICSLSVGSMLGEAGAASHHPEKSSIHPLVVRRMLSLVVLASAIGFAGTAYHACQSLITYGMEFSSDSLVVLGHILSVARYGGEQEPIMTRVLVAWVYSGALSGGMAYALVRTRRQKFLCFAPFLPAISFSFLVAAKANTLICLACWLGGYTAIKISNMEHPRSVFNRKSLLRPAVVLVAVVSFFGIVDALRTQKQGAEVAMEVDSARLKSASLGYLAAFSEWVESPTGQASNPLSFGAYTFAGLFDLAGLRGRATGVYTENVTLAGIDNNIYTVFRGLIEDFSLPGAVLVCLGIGLCSGCLYRTLRPGSGAAALGLSAYYAFLFWSPIGSLFTYNGPILAWLVGFFVIAKHSKQVSSLYPRQTVAEWPLRYTL